MALIYLLAAVGALSLVMAAAATWHFARRGWPSVDPQAQARAELLDTMSRLNMALWRTQQVLRRTTDEPQERE